VIETCHTRFPRRDVCHGSFPHRDVAECYPKSRRAMRVLPCVARDFRKHVSAQCCTETCVGMYFQKTNCAPPLEHTLFQATRLQHPNAPGPDSSWSKPSIDALETCVCVCAVRVFPQINNPAWPEISGSKARHNAAQRRALACVFKRRITPRPSNTLFQTTRLQHTPMSRFELNRVCAGCSCARNGAAQARLFVKQTSSAMLSRRKCVPASVCPQNETAFASGQNVHGARFHRWS
jgi:hypothetical protein